MSDEAQRHSEFGALSTRESICLPNHIADLTPLQQGIARRFWPDPRMAGSKYTYVRNFELPDPLLPSTFLVIRLDGKGFTGFSKSHSFEKPNDINALNLMNMAAKRTMEGKELSGECVLGFGESDEYSFIFKKSCKLYGRRSSKLVTLVTSLFTSAYVFLWNEYLPHTPIKLDSLPVFDGRIVQYSSETEVRDYLRWRQVDTHINNMYNTCFWALVLQGGLTTTEANKELSGTVSSQKQELLFSRFGINYNNLDPIFRKGSILLWENMPLDEEEIDVRNLREASRTLKKPADTSRVQDDDSWIALVPPHVEKPRRRKETVPKVKRKVVISHEDLINDAWWDEGHGKGLLQD